jgi:hypothetical protein
MFISQRLSKGFGGLCPFQGRLIDLRFSGIAQKMMDIAKVCGTLSAQPKLAASVAQLVEQLTLNFQRHFSS